MATSSVAAKGNDFLGGARGNDVIRSGRREGESTTSTVATEDLLRRRRVRQGGDQCAVGGRWKLRDRHPQVGDDETAAHCLRTFRACRTRRRRRPWQLEMGCLASYYGTGGWSSRRTARYSTAALALTGLSCQRHRKVRIVRFSTRRVIGVTTSNRFGKWKLLRRDVHGRFRARIGIGQNRVIRPGLTCSGGAFSHWIQLRLSRPRSRRAAGVARYCAGDVAGEPWVGRAALEAAAKRPRPDYETINTLSPGACIYPGGRGKSGGEGRRGPQGLAEGIRGVHALGDTRV